MELAKLGDHTGFLSHALQVDNIQTERALEADPKTSIHRILNGNVHQLTTRMQGPTKSISSAVRYELEDHHHKEVYRSHTFVLVYFLTSSKRRSHHASQGTRRDL